jgi:hypothetical protein
VQRVTWRCWRRCWCCWDRRADPRSGPNVGSDGGARRRQLWPRVVVMVVVRGKVGRSQRVTLVTFQPWLLDLATHGRLLLIIYNCIKIITNTYKNY